MSKLGVIVWKEVLDLVRDPKFVFGVLMTIMIFPLLGAMFTESFKGISAKPIISIIDKDLTDTSHFYVQVLSKYAEITQDDKTASAIVVIEKGFDEKLRKEGVLYLKVYYVFNTTGIASTAKETVISGVLKKAADDMFLELFHIKQEIKLDEYTIYKNKLLNISPSTFMGILMGPANVLTWAVFMVTIMVLQTSVISIASEKEYKTLEILLTQPISSFTVLSGKLIASIIIALVEGIATFIGFSIYFSSIISIEQYVPETPTTTPSYSVDIFGELRKAGLFPTSFSIILYLGVIIASLIFILSLGVVIGTLSSDTKSAGSITGILIPIFIIPAIFLMLSDIEALPLTFKIILLLIPYSHTVLAGRYMIMNNYGMLTLALIYNLVAGIALMYIASRIYSSETLLTFKLEFKKRRAESSES